MNKANLFLVGAPKAGTSTLYDVFSTVEDITVPKMKELNYFFSGVVNSYTIKRVKSLIDYDAIFKKGSTRYYLDASPSYLKCTDSARLISEYNKDSKIIIVLRDPVKRAYSNWKMDYYEGYVNSSFKSLFKKDYLSNENCIQFDYFKASCYYEGVKRYIDYFGRGNVMVLFFEDLVNAPDLFYQDINDFLNVNINSDMFSLKSNPARVPRSYLLHKVFKVKVLRYITSRILPQGIKNLGRSLVFNTNKKDDFNLSQEEVESYKKYFIEDIHKTEALLDINLSGWK
jgi:hypothetical protein